MSRRNAKRNIYPEVIKVVQMTYFKTWQTKGDNKYRAVKKTVNGIIYHSQKEANKSVELDYLVKAKEIKSWTRQVKEELRGENGTLICKVYPDFLITHNDGTLEYLEIKSKVTATPIWKLKWRLLQDKLRDKMKTGEVKMTVEY